jgi:hypothetical protein
MKVRTGTAAVERYAAVFSRRVQGLEFCDRETQELGLEAATKPVRLTR